MAALGASPARSSAAWDADGGGDDQALSYDQAYRDMFFIGDVTAAFSATTSRNDALRQKEATLLSALPW